MDYQKLEDTVFVFKESLWQDPYKIPQEYCTYKGKTDTVTRRLGQTYQTAVNKAKGESNAPLNRYMAMFLMFVKCVKDHKIPFQEFEKKVQDYAGGNWYILESAVFASFGRRQQYLRGKEAKKTASSLRPNLAYLSLLIFSQKRVHAQPEEEEEKVPQPGATSYSADAEYDPEDQEPAYVSDDGTNAATNSVHSIFREDNACLILSSFGLTKFCTICYVDIAIRDVDTHINSHRHERNLEEIRLRNTCNICATHYVDLGEHITSLQHKRNLKLSSKENLLCSENLTILNAQPDPETTLVFDKREWLSHKRHKLRLYKQKVGNNPRVKVLFPYVAGDMLQGNVLPRLHQGNDDDVASTSSVVERCQRMLTNELEDTVAGVVRNDDMLELVSNVWLTEEDIE